MKCGCFCKGESSEVGKRRFAGRSKISFEEHRICGMTLDRKEGGFGRGCACACV